MGTKNFVGTIASLIETANDKHFTLDAVEVMEFVKQVIAAITEEFSVLGKATAMSGEQALAKAEDIYVDADGELDENVDFFCDQEAMESIYETVYALMTEKNYKSDAVRIVESIKSDETFAYDFFYGTKPAPGKNIAGLRSRIINQVRMSYGVVVDPLDFNTILYEHLYSEGTWKVLNSYNYRSTIFQWLGTVASHCIMAHLEENGYIKISRARTPGNTRLVLKKKTPEYCRIVIDDMVKIRSMRDMLFAVYVDRIDQETIQERFGMDEEMYKLTLRASEKTLKTALLNTEHPYDDVLVDKGARKIMLSSDFLTIIGQTNAAYNEDSPLREVLGVTPDDTEFDTKVVDFLYNFTNNLDWSDEDKYVWQSRYIKNMKPDDVAENLPKRSRPWVDTRYSRLNRQFKEAIREWWANINR
ncbi:MAG: hypothetical protein IKK89_06695 [Alistipes sp.]|nr:hypothetical protein [Alistipes sp.]